MDKNQGVEIKYKTPFEEIIRCFPQFLILKLKCMLGLKITISIYTVVEYPRYMGQRSGRSNLTCGVREFSRPSHLTIKSGQAPDNSMSGGSGPQYGSAMGSE